MSDSTMLDLPAAVIRPSDLGAAYGSGPGTRCTTIEAAIDAGLVAAGVREAVPAADLRDLYARSVIKPGDQSDDRFARAGMNSPAITALAYLREAVAAGQGTRTLVSHVQKFLRGLPKEPALLLVPPPPGPMA